MSATESDTPRQTGGRTRALGWRSLTPSNQPGGFWVAAADPAASAEAVTGTLPTSDLAAVAALTDGATRIADRFHLIDWPKLLAVLAADGPADLIRRNREAGASDPDGRRWKRGKLTDDATAAY